MVLAHPPLAEGGAPGKCALGMLRGLVQHGIQPRALVARDIFMLRGIPVLAGPADLPDVRVEVEAIRPARARARAVLRPMAPYRHPPFLDRVKELAREADIVHLEQTQLVYAAEAIDRPSVVHIHSLVRRDQDMARPWQARFWSRVEFVVAERAAGRLHRHLVASSPVVADHLRRLAPSAEVVVAPLTIDPHHYTPTPPDGPPTAGIIGTGHWPPTARAMHRLIHRVWPLVKRAVPDARLLVAGRNLPAGLGTGTGVEVLGQVPSASDFFAGLSVLLYPLDRGSGMKVKVLEAMASGVPVVTTRDGAEGITSCDGIVIEENDERLAAAAAEILGDPDEQRRRGDAARTTFERHYAPAPATEPLVDLYRRIAG